MTDEIPALAEPRAQCSNTLAWAVAYDTVKQRYNLKHRERTFLDGHRTFEKILVAALAENWDLLDELMNDLLRDYAMALSSELAAAEPHTEEI